MSIIKLTDANRKELWRIFQRGPKPQLHLHLDGSLSFNFIKKAIERLRSRQDNHHVIFEKDWEPANEEELFEWFSNISHVKKNGFTTRNCNWKAFDICNLFLQTKGDLVEAASDIVVRICNEHNVNYLEIRFAPVLHTREGLTQKEVVNALAEGFEKGVNELKSQGKEFYGGLILCAMRSRPVADAIDIVNMISEMENEYVLGFDIAGDEGNFPLKGFEEALLLAKEKNVNVTVHAGEWNENLYENIIDNLKVAVDCGAKRIGHGVAIRSLDKNDEILTNMRAANIGVEVNITSNCTETTIVENFNVHPLPDFLEKDIKVAGLNVDNWLLAGNTDIGRAEPTGEYVRAFADCGVNADGIFATVQGGYLSAFKSIPAKFVEDSLEVWKNDIIPELIKWKESESAQS